MALFGLWLLVGAVLSWVTLVCLFGDVELALSPDQIRGGKVARVNDLPVPPLLWPGELDLEVFEDGHALGPRVEDVETVRERGEGAYAVSVRREPGLPVRRTLHFTASDGSRPPSDGRRYVVRFPRRELPAATVLVVASWILLPWGVILWWRSSQGRPLLPSVPAWSLVVAGAVYTLFVVQAWLPPANWGWLLAVGAVGLAPALACLLCGDWSCPRWFPWLAGLLAWAVCSSLGGSSYAAPASAVGFLAVAVGGVLLYLGFRQVFEGPEFRGASFLLGLFLLVAGLSLARDAGFDPAGALESLGLVPESSPRLVNLWTTKFVGHWLLVVGWSALAALGLGTRGRRIPAALVTILGALAVVLNGSKAAHFALGVSIVAAMPAIRWPTPVRRLCVGGLMVGLLLTPLLSSLPWSLQSDSTPSARQERAGSAEMAVRGGIWEFSRRMISLRPVEGWGFGATASLPGRQLPVAEALGLDRDTAGPKLSRHPALAGGHPHNSALLTWLDLGLVGALLVVGLVWAVGRSIAGVEERRGTHAALLGLLTVTAVFLVFNYPAWEPEVASILWMTAVLAAAILPRLVVSRRALLRSAAVVLLILAFGCSVLVYHRGAGWLTARELRTDGAVLDPEAGRLVLGDEVRDLEYSDRLDAGADLFEPGSGADTFIHGWAYGPPGAGAREAVLVFVGSELAGVVWPERPSPEAFDRADPKDVRALVSGFLIRVEPERLDLDAPVTVVALRPDGSLARELPPLSPEASSESTAPRRGPG